MTTFTLSKLDSWIENRDTEQLPLNLSFDKNSNKFHNLILCLASKGPPKMARSFEELNLERPHVKALELSCGTDETIMR